MSHTSHLDHSGKEGVVFAQRTTPATRGTLTPAAGGRRTRMATRRRHQPYAQVQARHLYLKYIIAARQQGDLAPAPRFDPTALLLVRAATSHT